MKIAFSFGIIVLCVVSKVKSQDFSSELGNANQKTENLTVAQKWQSMEKSLKKATGSLVKMALPHILKFSEGMNISSQCMQEGMKIVMGLRSLKPWAFRFIDSSAKLPDGLLVGSMANLGVYDECLETEVKDEKGKEKVLFRGKYCTIDIKLPVPPMAKFYRRGEIIPELQNITRSGTVIGEAAKYAAPMYFFSIKTAICVPSGCATEDIDQVAQKLGEYLMMNLKTYRCEVKEKPHFTKTVICAFLVFSLFGFLMLIGSVIDMYSYYTGVLFKGTPARIFLSFSFISNFKKLINTNTTSDNLSCLHGLRFLSLSWIILGHTYYTMNFQAIQNFKKTEVWGSSFAFQVIVNGSVAVDSFYFMGGLLVCYLTIKHVNIDGKPFSVLMYIVHRLWRIYPAYIVALFLLFITEGSSSGPMKYYEMQHQVDYCYKNWWANLLFINNFYDVDSPCLANSWYIASDFQLYIAALLILIPLTRFPKVGIYLSILGIIASILYNGIQTYLKDFLPTMLFILQDQAELQVFWRYLYFPAISHAAPYCIGLLIGYLLATQPKLEMSKRVQIIGWIAAFICCFSTLYGVHNWNSSKEIDLFAGLMYASLHRTAWTVGIAWMVVCCASGRGGVINYILSWKIFIPLGRLTFVAYLVHPIVQIGFMANLRTVFTPEHFFMVWIYLASLWISYAVAFCVTLAVESPMIALEKMVFRRKKKTGEPGFERKNSVLNGTLKAEKNGDIAIILDKNSEETLGMDNPTLTKMDLSCDDVELSVSKTTH